MIAHAWSPTQWSGYSKLMIAADMTIVPDPSCGLPPDTAIMLAGLMRMRDIYAFHELADPHLAAAGCDAPPIRDFVQRLMDGDIIIIRRTDSGMPTPTTMAYLLVHNQDIEL